VVFDKRTATRTTEITAINGAIATLKAEVQGRSGVIAGALVQAARKLHRAAPKGDVQPKDKVAAKDPCKCGGKEDGECDCKEGKRVEKVVTKKDLKAVFSMTDKDDSLPSFLQTGSVKNARVFKLIKSKALQLKSPTLLSLALHLSEGQPDHFEKIREMIRDLIGKLRQEEADEGELGKYCEDGMKKAIKKQDTHLQEREAEAANIATAEKEIDEQKGEITRLQAELAQNAKELKELKETCAAEKAAMEQDLQDAKDGKAGLTEALNLLNTATSFVQVSQPTPNAGADGLSRGSKGETVDTQGFDFEDPVSSATISTGGSIIVFLTSLKEDFDDVVTTLDGDVTVEGSIAQQEEQCSADQGDLEAAARVITGNADLSVGASVDPGSLPAAKTALTNAEDDLSDAEFDKTLAEEGLVAVNGELEDLKGECVTESISHEDRVKMREQEIESLNEALEILEDMTGNFLQKRA
jgi:hypothetical protein